MYRPGRPVRKTVPVNLIVGEESFLVIGGGRVGLRKTRGLLEAGTRVTLLCPDAVEELVALAASGTITWWKRDFAAGDTVGHQAVFACTDDKHVNRAVLDDARRHGVLCCCCDMNWPDGDFTTPATARLGELTVSVSTSGQSCKTARDAKNEIVSLLSERRDLELIVLGTSDALVPSRKRAPYHLPAAERAQIGPLVASVRGVREFFILNTCNRVEIVLVVSRASSGKPVETVMRLAGFDRLAANERFTYSGFEAFRHLVRVTSGLESSLLGEFHVVSQIKDALAEAESAGWSGSALRFMGAEVMRVSKLVRHAVEGLLRVAEIDQVAVRYLSVHGGLDAGIRVAVIGTGMVGSGVAEALVKAGAHVTWIYHRHEPPAGIAAEVVQMAEMEPVLAAAEIVVSAVDSAVPVVTPAFLPAVADRNVLFVDLGLPRNIDPFFDDCGRGVTVADLDALKMWHRVKTGTLEEVLARADGVIRTECAPDFFK